MSKTVLIVIIIFAALGIVYLVGSGDETAGPLTGTVRPVEPVTGPVVEPAEPIAGEPEETISENDTVNGFIQCLADAGVVIYGSKTCPACAQLEQEYGGYEIVKPIYLDCSGLGTAEERERCMNEMQTMYVPEIQIKGNLFKGWGSPEALAEATGCQL